MSHRSFVLRLTTSFCRGPQRSSRNCIHQSTTLIYLIAMSMFDTYLKVDYRRLLPGGGGGGEESLASPSSMDTSADFGVYEDEESRAARNHFYLGECNFTCPPWCENYLPQLSLKERLLGCATCMVCGYLLGLGSFMRMKYLLTGNPVPLVVSVTVGNILTLCGTCFLTGPQQQARRMFHESRKVASIMYLGGMGATIFFLLLPHFRTRGFWLFMLLIAQYVAITWYCLSYIPFARDIMKRFCRRMVGSADSMGDEFG